MNFGLENYVIDAPFSLLISLILFSGTILIGFIFNKFFFFKILGLEYKENYIFFSPITGSYILMLFCFYLIVFNIMNTTIFKVVAYALIILGLFYIIHNFLKINKIFKINFKNKYNLILIIILISLFFISASPITHSDALHYHVNGAIDLLNTGEFYSKLLPMNLFLVSIGEIFLSIGLSVGAEQYASIIQFSSILALIPLFNIFEKKKNTYGLFFYLLIITTPITIFLISSPKPQLLFAISSSIIFFTILKTFDGINIKNLKIFFLFSLIVLSLNFIAKYSFVLSSSLLFLLLIYKMYKRNLLQFALFGSLTVFLFLVLPFLSIKFKEVGYSITSQMITGPLPINIYGFQKLHEQLASGDITLLQLFIPGSIGQFSTIYGPSLILILFFLNKNVFQKKEFFLIVTIFLVVSFFKGSNLPRFMYEGFIWLNLLVFYIYKTEKKKDILLKYYTLLQSILICFIVLFLSFKLFPGSITNELREKVMNENADGYKLSKWANSVLDENDVLISSHTSVALFNVQTLSPIFTWVVNFDRKKSIIYSNYLKKIKVNKILFYGENLNNHPFKKCLGKKIDEKKNVGKRVGRNPFNKGNFYNAWIYEFRYENLPKCLSR